MPLTQASRAITPGCSFCSVLDRSIAHRRVDELPDLLQPGDLLVVNNTKVLAARVAGRKRPSGAEVEILFVKDLGDAIWEVLIKGTFRPGQIIEMGAEAVAVVVERGRDQNDGSGRESDSVV